MTNGKKIIEQGAYDTNTFEGEEAVIACIKLFYDFVILLELRGPPLYIKR